MEINSCLTFQHECDYRLMQFLFLKKNIFLSRLNAHHMLVFTCDALALWSQM